MTATRHPFASDIDAATRIAEPDFDLLDALVRTDDPDDQAHTLARVVLAAFDNYYAVSRRIPALAQAAFEARDWAATVRLSKIRLGLYTACIDQLVPLLKAGLPELANDEQLWARAEAELLAAIAERYEADFAFAFWQSLRRKLVSDEWRPVSYDTGPAARPKATSAAILKTIATTLPIRPAVIRDILDGAGLRGPWRDRDGDAALAAAAIEAALEPLGPRAGETAKIEIAESGFFRNRGACLVGRVRLRDRGDMPMRNLPLLIALLNEDDGLVVDAVLCDADELQYAFSSTLANYHATNPHYHELARLLHELMPKRPLGTQYSCIGFHHLGKVAVMTEILAEHRRSKEKLDTAPGFKGTVAIAFTMPSSAYVLKIIRDHPTDDYKFDYFDGLDAVLRKYNLVHEIDRAGSMLDNIIYSNVKLERTMFAPDLLDELLESGIDTVTLERGALVFRHLIVQIKLTPLPLYLTTASAADARAAVINLGDCIKNNAAADIFNKDLDGRNYGVSRIRKVYLFDYDAVEPLTDVRVRGDDAPPGPEFEDGVVFRPADMLGGLRIDDPALRRAFRDAHPELMQPEYWQGMQRALRAGKVPRVMNYPAARRLRR
ncbi:(Isocitrate dehydrogenase (NADP+)) kinase [Rhodopseudomonas palustris HaA2]|uniref:Isocitrate dehydrogenase kinase/phosphatase n=1 Tax=Rhodopseudomonas palustris (strain HaA2) TaxID=316058 RepID=ACEK_RHOP2|nr:bifunctional isocitrate dehydrogenase kinase/phosphatase [Rhodopseudomonas palustris]Q2J2X6.1 RecName: Full=Isocitrate dehydrogenase kinase/phosphatase; Short=IDH kinase/phosphatase; Short=IDHK/P [Rhodopseudomonas palustris HaA2]ABD05184.1 (Isocitrate dehydrogenase (NADP+)) kinase [Rhodopseudomonas palustris HaA2]